MPPPGYNSPVSYIPPRIPKLQYRNRLGDDAVNPVPSSYTPSRPLTSDSGSAVTPPSPSPPAYGFPPSPELSPKEGKKKGVLGFFTMKEPSSLALQELTQQQRKESSVKSTKAVLGLPQPSERKMPAHVPKVNSKWDGLPVQHQRQKSSKDSWKGSIDLPSPFSRTSKRLGEESKRTLSTGRSSGTSLRRSNSAEDRPQLPLLRTPSPTNHGVARPAKFERSVSYETSEEPVKSIMRKSASMSTLDTPSMPETAFSLDGQQWLPFEPTMGSTVPFVEAKLVKKSSLSNPAESTPPPVTLKKGSPDSPVLNNNASDSLAQANKALTQSLSEDALQIAPKLGLEPESWPLPQWPLASEPEDVVVRSSDHSILRPPVPTKSQTRITTQNPSSTFVYDMAGERYESNRPSTPSAKIINDESREYRPAPGSRAGPISPPQSPDSKKLAKSFSGPSTPPSPPIVRTDLRPPVHLPGRTLTKNSDLPTIPESRPTSQVDIGPTNGHEPDDESLAESQASSMLSAQWFKSPQERLGLGSFIKRTGDDFSWPLSGENDGTFFVDGDGNKSRTRSSDRGMKGRASLMGIFRK